MLSSIYVLPGKLYVPVTVGFLPVLTVAFLRRAGAIRERRTTPNQKIWIPAHRCLSTCCVDGLSGLCGGAGLVWELFVSELVTAAIACLRPEGLKLGSGCVVCCMDLSITPQKGIPSQSNPT